MKTTLLLSRTIDIWIQTRPQRIHESTEISRNAIHLQHVHA